MKKIMKVWINCVLIVLFFMLIQAHVVLADVGSFESYDSDWGGSDWSSSSWDSDWDSGGGIYIVGGSGGFGTVVFAIIVIIAIISAISQKGKYQTKPPRHRTMNYQPMPPREVTIHDTELVGYIQRVDPFFNKEEFLSFAKSLFVKLQEAWTARDWSTIRTFETNELFEQHRKQLQGYIDHKQINVMERICVKSAYLSNFVQSGDKDILTIVLNSKMIDYIIDEDTKKVIKGDTVTERHSSYKMTFIRKTGMKTQEGTNEVKTTNCPNCGAPTEITSSGKCEYCGSVITTGEYNWALSNLEKIQ